MFLWEYCDASFNVALAFWEKYLSKIIFTLSSYEQLWYDIVMWFSLNLFNHHLPITDWIISPTPQNVFKQYWCWARETRMCESNAGLWSDAEAKVWNFLVCTFSLNFYLHICFHVRKCWHVFINSGLLTCFYFYVIANLINWSRMFLVPYFICPIFACVMCLRCFSIFALKTSLFQLPSGLELDKEWIRSYPKQVASPCPGIDSTLIHVAVTTWIVKTLR